MKASVLESLLTELLAFRLSGLQLYQKEILTQVFSCKHCEMFKNSFFIEQLEHLRWLSLFFKATENSIAAQSNASFKKSIFCDLKNNLEHGNSFITCVYEAKKFYKLTK